MTNGAGSAGGPGVQDAPDTPPLRPAVPPPPGTSPLEPSDPVRVGEYDLIATLGIGGMGSVYLGQGPDGQRAAVKVVHSHLAADAEFRSRFTAEIAAAQRVPAFCTAPVRDSGTHLGRPYLVTDFIDGLPLSRLVADQGPLDAATVHSIAVSSAAALTAIHGAGVVHRDLKPSNVLIAMGGVRIIDFGIARSLDIAHSHTRTGVILGSLGWASPEQLNAAPATPAMDVFGWGCMIAFAGIGRHPFGGEEAATRAWRILNGEPELDDLPESVRSLVEAALRRDPSHRPTARQLLLALTQASSVGSEDLSPPVRKKAESSRRGRRDAAVAAAVIPLGVALVFGVVKATTGALPILVDPVRDESPVVTTTAQNGGAEGNDSAVDGPQATTSGRPGETQRTRPGTQATTPAGQGPAATTPAVVTTTPVVIPPTTPPPTTEPTTEPPPTTPPPSTDPSEGATDGTAP